MPRCRRRAVAHRFAFALAPFVLIACSAGREAASDEPAPLDNVEEVVEVETQIRVENRHWSDVTVYLLRRSARARLGIVTSNSTTSFRVPIGMNASGSSDIALIADAIGSDEEYRSDRLTVLEGQEIVLKLEVRLAHSSTSVFWP
ncbi:MAG: hypothetical protein ABFS34_15290 [Gemmatimonadota bacterium]